MRSFSADAKDTGSPHQREKPVVDRREDELHQGVAAAARLRDHVVRGQVHGLQKGRAPGRGVQPHHEDGHQLGRPPEDLEV